MASGFVDIDECTSTGICQHTCRNTWGSYVCSCYTGYKVAADGRSCEGNCPCSTFHAQLFPFSGTLQLLVSVRFIVYKVVVLPYVSNNPDIDECNLWSERGGRLCVGVCTNTPGSYTCGCPDGYRMLGDGRTCQGKCSKFL